MPIVAPTGYRYDSVGRTWKEPPFPYQRESDIDARTYVVRGSDLTKPPSPNITVTICPAAIARALHPEWPEAIRPEEV